MRGLLWVTVVLAALWGGWWVVGSRGAMAAAEGWFAQAATEGRRAGYEDLAVAGFPNRFDLTVTRPHLGDPATGFGWQAPFAQVFAMSWKPWHLIAALPGGQVITTPDARITLQSDRLMASLLMVPGVDLALSEAVVEGAALALSPSYGGVEGVARAVASIRAEEGGVNRYRLGLALSDLAVAPEVVASGLAAKVETVTLDATLGLSAALDRNAGQTPPALRQLALRDMQVRWGDLTLQASGDLAPDLSGYAAGRIDIRVTGWRLLPPGLVALGLIAPGFAPSLERGFEMMAAQGADPEVLVLPLVAKAGRMSLGPLPLGPAPYWGD